MIRWGFIGCGIVTEQKSGPAFGKVEDSEVVAVMRRDAAKAQDYAERHGIGRWYSDAQQLIDDPAVNAIYVATPPSTHAQYAIAAMRAGKPVYVEKPMAASYDECAEMIRVSEETGVPCFVAYYRRTLPYFQRVKQLIDDGMLGDISTVQIRFAIPPYATDYNRDTLPWRVKRLPVVVISTIWLLTNWIYSTFCLVLSPMHVDTLPTLRDCMRWKIRFLLLSNSNRVWWVAVVGVLWRLAIRAPTPLS